MVPPRDIKGIRGNRPKLRGDTKPRPPAPVATPVPPPQSVPQGVKRRVLFVCIGNSCRSQMAEAFARVYGSDVLWVQSAGLSPASIVQPLTKQTLAERNVDIGGQFPKGLEMLSREQFDLVINMSGEFFQFPSGQMVEWQVRDPIGQSPETYRAVAQQIEGLVMRLIMESRGTK